MPLNENLHQFCKFKAPSKVVVVNERCQYSWHVDLLVIYGGEESSTSMVLTLHGFLFSNDIIIFVSISSLRAQLESSFQVKTEGNRKKKQPLAQEEGRNS